MSDLVGKDDEFEAVMRANGPKIYTLAVRLTGNVSEGQDLAQEAFLKAYGHWETFRGDAEASTWLYRICVNCWKNRVRYEKRRAFWKHFSLDGGPADNAEPGRELAAQEPALDAPLEARERQAAVQSALNQLKAEDRALIVMREIEDKSYEEIAALLDVPIGTVRSRLARAREKLAEICSKISL